jgi:hypothetical protein
LSFRETGIADGTHKLAHCTSVDISKVLVVRVTPTGLVDAAPRLCAGQATKRFRPAGGTLKRLPRATPFRGW